LANVNPAKKVAVITFDEVGQVFILPRFNRQCGFAASPNPNNSKPLSLKEWQACQNSHEMLKLIQIVITLLWESYASAF